MYGITATVSRPGVGAGSSHQPFPPFEGSIKMALLVFLVLVALASWLGLTKDTRDSADWKESSQGARAARWH
jgi:hypothetical protein